MRIREATPEELPAVLNVIDGALLSVDIEQIERQLETGGILVAVEGDERGRGKQRQTGNQRTAERVLGALVLEGGEIRALAVRRRRRGQGIGTALVEAARDRRDRLVAEFDERVWPFWDSLECSIEAIEESDRYRARL